MRFVLVTLFDNEGHGDEWHFGCWSEAKTYAEKNTSADGYWHAYSLEEQEFIPCDETKPMGQFYIGVHRMEFVDKRER